ncbi:MAG: SH3 domain-containing protein [Paracoccaceae bacterium]
MNRYILLAFLFMGWTFYELSGGADFVPPSANQAGVAEHFAEPETIAVSSEPVIADLAPPKPAPKPEPVVLPDVTQKLELAAEPAPDDAPEELIVAAISAEIPISPEPTESNIVLSTEWSVGEQTQSLGTDTVFSLASLGQLTETVPETAPAPPSQDLAQETRFVTATRVNVRSGPGTDHSVVSSLTSGAEVQVLNDPGDGWVKMRHNDSETVGWMAASLLAP